MENSTANQLERTITAYKKEIAITLLKFPKEIYNAAHRSNKLLDKHDFDLITLEETDKNADLHNQLVYDLYASVSFSQRANSEIISSIKKQFINAMYKISETEIDAYPEPSSFKPWLDFFMKENELSVFFDLVLPLLNEKNNYKWFDFFYDAAKKDNEKNEKLIWKNIFVNDKGFVDLENGQEMFMIKNFEQFCEKENKNELKEKVLYKCFWNNFEKKCIAKEYNNSIVELDYLYEKYSPKIRWSSIVNKALSNYHSMEYINLDKKEFTENTFGFLIEKNNQEFKAWINKSDGEYIQAKENDKYENYHNFKISKGEMSSLRKIGKNNQFHLKNVIHLLRHNPDLQSYVLSFFEKIVMNDTIPQTYKNNQPKRI